MSQFYPRDRFFSAPPSNHNIAMQYGFNPGAYDTGNPGVTGNWVPLLVGSSFVSNTTPSGNIGTSMVTGNVLHANNTRVMWSIQNVGSGSALYVKLGNAPASATSFNYILKPATSDFGGDGGLLTNDTYTGPVSISGATRFSVFEM